MVSKFLFSFSKLAGKSTQKAIKLTKGNGKSYPGYIFLKFASLDGLKELSSKLSSGILLVTGTNGKTTTTTLLTKFFDEDMEYTKSFENNTINAIATSLLNSRGDLGVFEYGIRNKKFAIPDLVQKYLDPKCILYTNISREHVQVVGVKNSFLDYFNAKELLSRYMEEGVIVVNSDNPYVGKIGLYHQQKAEAENLDLHVNFYGFDLDLGSSSMNPIVNCPLCGETLNYSKYYIGDSGVYSCSCGFSRPEPTIKVYDIQLENNVSIVKIKGTVYNWQIKDYFDVDFVLKLPLFGIHNIYNVLAAISAYLSFTPTPLSAKQTIYKVCNNLDFSILPPGRFELMSVKNKFIGAGQGDNGNAFSVNAQFMQYYVYDDLELIYTTPDLYEEEIFEDHFEVIRSMNPKHIICVPGRNSIEQAEKYANKLKEEFDVDFYPLSSHDLSKRVDDVIELALNSQFTSIFISGCGEEHKFWANMINKFKLL